MGVGVEEVEKVEEVGAAVEGVGAVMGAVEEVAAVEGLGLKEKEGG